MRRILLINARPVQRDGEKQVLVAVQDITVQKQAERILLEEQQRLIRSLEAGASELGQTLQILHTESYGKERAQTVLGESEMVLLHNRGELRAAMAKLLQSQEEERRRLSTELHDDLAQKIGGLQVDVEALERQLPSDFQQLKTGLLSVSDEVAALSNDVRQIANRLHPSVLDHLGLSEALRLLCKEFGDREQFAVNFTVEGVPKTIPNDIGSCLYRVAQEALRNVTEHARATQVSLTLSGSPGRLSLSVRDNGIGFDVRGEDSRLGLISMQERVRLVNGVFSLETKPGQGVLIAIHVPM